MTPEDQRYYQGLGKRIAAMRKGSKISQLVLSEMLGVERTSITNIEAGRQTLRVDQLLKIARICGKDVKTLI